MSEFAVEVGSWEELGDRAAAVRTAVFVEEQGVPETEEIDGKDPAAVQFLARDGEYPVGTARLRFPKPTVGKAERVAVREPYRGEGVGAELMATVEGTARERGATEIRLHAQTRVEGFYRSLGYETVSDEFEEAGISHVAMVKRLTE